MNDLFSGALPMGMVFFGIMVLGVLRRKTGNAVARSQYPALAQKLGLVYRPSSFKQGVGRLEGTFEGYPVIVDPDDQRRIFVRFSVAPKVELHSFVHNKRSAQGQQSFRPSDRVLAAQFKTAHASPPFIAALNAATHLPEALKPLKFIRQLKRLSVTEGGVTAIFEYGNPPFIPADVVEDLLPRLVELARVFEPRASSSEGAPSASSVAPEHSAELH